MSASDTTVNLDKSAVYPFVIQTMQGSGDTETVLMSADGKEFPVPANAKMKNASDSSLFVDFMVNRPVKAPWGKKYLPGWTAHIFARREEGGTPIGSFVTTDTEPSGDTKAVPGSTTGSKSGDYLLVQEDGMILIATEQDVKQAKESGKFFTEEQPEWRAGMEAWARPARSV